MNPSDLASNLLSPPVLCFFLGLAAALFRSDLELPAPVPKALALILLFAIGFKGGLALAEGGFDGAVLLTLLAALAAAVVVPFWTFFALRGKLGPTNAAAVAATYGSVSAVTFMAAAALLATRGVPYSGHMVAALALMESPAIVIGIVLARKFAAGTPSDAPRLQWSHLGKEAFLNGSIFLLLGSLVIGFLCGPERGGSLMPFVKTLFPGLLTLFLLDLGLVAGHRLADLRNLGGGPVAYAVFAPLINASLGLGLAAALGLSHGDALLLVVLCASASYIAVPAALRTALPEANPAVYVTLSLAVTFPFNLVVGIPLYELAVSRLLEV